MTSEESYRIKPGPPGDVSCGQARDMARRILSQVGAAADRMEDVLVVVSELISNARRHGGGVTEFQITARPGTVTVEVSDRSPRRPRQRPWAPAAPGGFGWRLTNSLADRTDVRFHRGGKTVVTTFTTGRPGPSPAL
ncbi:ATP-binding protein [Streptomyces sp. NPDC058662]|uniref:ATP-binding protein n=1 Tax=Streptomyces sp. NPDC058662 TaxID=3346583 RepID=UPI00364E643F